MIYKPESDPQSITNNMASKYYTTRVPEFFTCRQWMALCSLGNRTNRSPPKIQMQWWNRIGRTCNACGSLYTNKVMRDQMYLSSVSHFSMAILSQPVPKYFKSSSRLCLMISFLEYSVPDTLKNNLNHYSVINSSSFSIVS
jgi:hypothetical protein